MKPAKINFVTSGKGVRMPDGKIKESNDGDVTWLIRFSIFVSIPDAATPPDVLRLGEEYVAAIRSEWDSESPIVFDDGVSVVYTDADPPRADVEFTLDENCKLVVKDER